MFLLKLYSNTLRMLPQHRKVVDILAPTGVCRFQSVKSEDQSPTARIYNLRLLSCWYRWRSLLHRNAAAAGAAVAGDDGPRMNCRWC